MESKIDNELNDGLGRVVRMKKNSLTKSRDNRAGPGEVTVSVAAECQ